jgi:hypothetical protein
MTQISPAVQTVLELFQGPLASLRFADIDGAGLSQLATEVQSAASAVDLQEAKLAELRQTLTQRQDALLVQAQRALAYARVYAEHDAELTQQLSLISLPRAAKARKTTSTQTSNTDAAEPLELAAAETSTPSVDAPSAGADIDAVAPKARKMKRARESRAFTRDEAR